MLVLPLYGAIDRKKHALAPTGARVDVSLGWRRETATIWKGALGKVPVWLVEHPDFFGGRELYGRWDDAARFTFFAKVVAELLRQPLEGEPFDVFHGHDWQTGLVPAFLKVTLRQPIAAMFTIHNLAYQGVFDGPEYALTGLPPELYAPRALEYWGKWSMLKSGLVFSDLLTTVSERYAMEIETPEFGAGLEGVLLDRKNDLFGVLNGVDYEQWSPDKDKLIAARYGAENPSPKELCRSALLREVGLPRGDDVPLVGMVSRLAEQKGFDLVLSRLSPLLDLARVVILGSGEPRLEAALKEAALKRPDRLAVKIGYDDALAHRIEAGADLFLMPSRYEPCGLNQIYSLRYGAVPVVRATGGLDDTVIDADVDAARGTGFKYEKYDAEQMLSAVGRAISAWRDPARWSGIMRRGMQADFSWWRAAQRYGELYRETLKRRV